MLYLIEFFCYDDLRRKVTTRLSLDSALSCAMRYDYWMIVRGRNVGDIFRPVKVVARSCVYRQCWPCLCIGDTCEEEIV